MKRLFLQIALVLAVAIPSFGQVKLNEIQTSNSKTQYDPDFLKYKDWVELYNSSSSAINLEGYYLSDNKDKPRKWQIPAGQSIPAKGYLVIYCDGEDVVGKAMHTNFKLSSGGDVLLLYTPTMFLSDSIHISLIETDYTYGRLADGTGEWGALSKPTPGKANVTTTVKGLAPKPIFSVQGGFYSKNQTITLSSELEGAVIRYTTDGSEPTESSPIYSGAITAEKTSSESLISGYNRQNKTQVQHYQWTSGDGQLSNPSVYEWGKVEKGFVLKAKVFHDDYVPSVTACQTYFINMSRPSLPIVSVTVDKGSFFSADSGIYIQGTKGCRRGGDGDVTANWNHDDWERKVHVEYFDVNGNRQFGVNAGAKVMGAVSRHSDLKSLNIIMRKKYEDGEINYPLFGEKGLDTYQSFVLRNSGNDWEQGMFARDAVIQSIVNGTCDLETQGYQPVVMYLNGEYWSFINLRERYDKHYFGGHHDYVDEGNIDLLKINGDQKCFNASEGDSLRWEELMAYLAANSMTDADNYNYVKNHYVDVDNMINYYIAQLYCQNTDWPNNNMRLWRPRTENGKFRFPWYDTDFGYGLWGGGAGTNPFENFDSNKKRIAVAFFYYMMENEDFKNEFIQRFHYMINTVYDASRSKGIINSVEDNISAERSTSDSKWQRIETARYSGYKVESVLNFANDRPSKMRDFLDAKFNYKGTAKLTVNYTNSQGTVQLCGLDVTPGYSGKQYKSTPIRMTAIPKDGYKFKCWQDGSSTTLSTDLEYKVTIKSDYTIKAVFESRSSENNLFINEFLTSNTTDILSPIGKNEDWIEIYNAGTSAVNLAGLYLSDDRTNLTKYQIPYTQIDSTAISSKGYVLFYADNDYKEGALHLPFKLDKAGGVIILSQKSTSGAMTVIDSIHYEKQNTDVSYGRYPDGSSNLTIFTGTTPRSSNSITSDTDIDGLVITELMTKNETTVMEETGTYADWFEIYNTTSKDIDLGGLFVTNDLKNPNMYMIPKGEPAKTTIKAGEYFVFWCDKQTAINPNHVDFKLNAEKGDLALVQLRGSENYIIDQLSYSNQGADVAYGRYPSESSDFMYLLNPTPGSANRKNTAVDEITGVTINEVLALNTSIITDETGAYSDYIEFYNSTSSAIDLGGLYISDSVGFSLRYRIPTTNSKLTTVQPGKWLILWADGKPELGENHLDFSLDGAGEDVVLSLLTENGLVVIDQVSFGAQTENVSYGRYPETFDNWETMSPTVGEKNQSFNSSVALKSLTSSKGTILPALSTSILTYECAVPAGTTEVPTISAVPVHDKATATITQATSFDDVAVIKVISANGFNTETYKVSFKIAASDDATLASLVSAGGTMSPAFNPDTYNYVVNLSTAYVPYVTAIASNENAMVEIDYAKTASESTVVTVTAENGETQSYEITYTLSSSQNVVTEWSDDFESGIGNLSTNNGQHIISEHTTTTAARPGTAPTSNTDVAIALDEKKADEEYGYVEYHLPTGYVLDGSAALNVSFDVNVPNDGSSVNGVIVSNQYINLSIGLVDKYGNVSNFMSSEVNSSSSSHSVNFGSASFISKSAIVAVRIGLYGPNDSKKDRQKAMYIDNLVIGPKTATGVSQTVVLSSNADLTTLTASDGTLSPSFSKTVADYTLTLPAGTEEIPTISATVADETATLEIAQASDLNGMAYVTVISQDMSEINEYTIQLVLTPSIKEGHTDYVIQPAMKGWSGSSDLYQLAYNGGDVAVAYNRTTGSSDAITYNVTDAASKILDMEDYPYASVKMKTTVATNLFVELFDSKGNKTAATVEAASCEPGNEMLTYIFDFTGKLSSIDLSDVRGMNIYFDKGSATPKNGTIKIDELRLGKDVEITVNQAPIWSVIADQEIQDGGSFTNLNLVDYVLDDYTESENLVFVLETGSENLSMTIEDGFLKVSVVNAGWIGEENIKVSATDEAGESSVVTIKYAVSELRIDLTSISFTQESVDLVQNESENIGNYLTLNPSDATIESIEWSVSDKNIASISGIGVLKNLLNYGTEDITITVVVEDKSGSKFTKTLPATLTGCPNRVSLVSPNENTLSLYYGETGKVEYTLYPDNACEKSVTYSSSNSEIATVSTTGVVTAGNVNGETTITISVNDGFSVTTAECVVSVSKDCSGDIELSLNKSSLSLLEGYSATLIATITPDDECTQDKEIIWSSSNTKVTVDENGKITANEEGTAVITASTTGTGVTTATCTVTVSRNCTSGAVDVAISSTEKTMYLNDKLSLTAEITTGSPCNEEIVWSSSDETIAKVVDGEVVSLKKYGTAVIRATAVQDKGSYAECTVSVVERKVESVEVTAARSRMSVGETQTVTATIFPENADDKNITWKSSDDSVAIISSKGVVTALKDGAVTIIAEAANNKSGYATILVLPIEIISISLDPSSVILNVGDEQSIGVTFNPPNATKKEITWKSFDESVAVVEDGVIRAVAEGTTQIAATTSNGITEAVSVQVDATVVPVNSVSVSPSELTMNIGDVEIISSEVLPDEANNKKLSWKSSNPDVATVSVTTGEVTAVGAGEAVITATSVNGISDEVQVSVEYRKISSVGFSNNTIVVEQNQTVEMVDWIELNPSNVEVQSMSWSVTDANASISENGLLTNNLAFGTKDVVVTVEVIDMYGTKKTATKAVTLNGCATRINSIKVNPQSLALTLSEDAQLNVSTMPIEACVNTISYTSLDPSIVAVSSTGNVSPKSVGTTTIVVKVSDGYDSYQAEIPVQVDKEYVAVASVSFASSQLTKQVGDKFKLVATITPDNATEPSLQWSSSDSDVATVDTDGNVEIKSSGSVTITATAKNGEKATCYITAKDVEITSIVLSDKSLSIEINSTETLTATVNADATNKSIAWSSSNESVATVDDKGNITAIGVGTCEIKAKAGKVEETCIVTVKHIEPVSLAVNPTSVTVDIDKSVSVKATWLPATATDTSLVWTSNNVNIATVSNGVITGVSAGTTNVVVKIGNTDLSESIPVTVNPMVATSISLNTTTAVLLVNQQQSLIATILPEKTSDKSVVWTSSNPSVVSVDNTGKITALKLTEEDETVTITATTENNLTATCSVSVTKNVVAVTSVTMDPKYLTMTVNSYKTITAVANPSNATNRALTWESKNKAVATVDQYGTITAKSVGTVEIVATSTNGLSATCFVTVKEVEVEAMELDAVSLAVSESKTLTANITPASATNVSLTWSVEDESIATINATSGKITGVAEGTTIVKVTAKNGVYAEAEVSVSATAIPVTSIRAKGAKYIEIGVPVDLSESIVFTPAAATNQALTWSIINSKATYEDEFTTVATIDANKGIITGLVAGSVKVMVKSVSNPNATTTMSVAVNPINPNEISLNKTATEIVFGDKDTLFATVKPTNASCKNVTWSSSNTDVAAVSQSGVVTAYGKGTATIYARSTEKSAVYATCKVTVIDQPITKITPAADTIKFTSLGVMAPISVSVEPSYAETSLMTWVSLNPAVASIEAWDENNTQYMVTANAYGTAEIIVTASSGISTKIVCVIAEPEKKNTAPIISPIPDQTLTVGESVTIDLNEYYIDMEKDAIVWSIDKNGSNINGTINSSGIATFTIDNENGQMGMQYVLIKAKDARGASAQTNQIMFTLKKKVSEDTIHEAIEDVVLQNVAVYPNPTVGPITISIETAAPEICSVEIYSMNGRKVYATQMPVFGECSIDFDLLGNAKGVYFVKVTTGKEQKITKIVLK